MTNYSAEIKISGIQCVKKENIYFHGLMKNYTLFPIKKLVHKKLKSFP